MANQVLRKRGEFFKELTFSPAEQGGYELKHLELLRIRTIESDEMEKVVGDKLSGFRGQWRFVSES